MAICAWSGPAMTTAQSEPACVPWPAPYSGYEGTSKNCHRSSGGPIFLANDSALFSFRFCAVHVKEARDRQLEQFFEVPISLNDNLTPCGRPLGISVHDRIIVGKEGHATFKGLRLI